MRMLEEYAQKILEGGQQFYTSFFSLHDNLLVCKNTFSDEFTPFEPPRDFVGTQLNEDGSLQVDDFGYVTFRTVKPVVDENTRFTHPS